MKNSSSIVIGLLVLVLSTKALCAELTLKWGIEKPSFYKETKATSRQNSALRPPRRQEEKLYRYFEAADPEYYAVAAPLFERHWQLWPLYERQAAPPSPEGYAAFVKEREPYLSGALKELAPVMYFDFVGVAKSEYVLVGVEIRTIAFEEYKGGGFVDKEAWYDIVLSHKPGKKLYPVDKKLRFTGSGRLELRLWSDNYSGGGMAPMGCYMLDVTFHFLVDSKKTLVATGPFKIDV